MDKARAKGKAVSGDSRRGPTKAQLQAEIAELRRQLAALETAAAERVREEQALREREEKYRVLLDESSDPIFTFYPDGEYRYVNNAFARGVGKMPEEIIGKKIWDIFPHDEAEKRFAAVKWVFENATTKVIEVRVPRAGGDLYFITTVKPILGEGGRATTVICISKDITERKRMEEELQRLGTHDTLTGLYNRNFFEAELLRLQKSRDFPISVVVADMDNLKTVNDRQGHAVGDAKIRTIAEELRRSFRAEDVIARIGGDEFAVLVPAAGEPATRAAVERLRANIEKHQDLHLALSIGLATGEEGSLLADVMRRADDRMYQDKGVRRGRR